MAKPERQTMKYSISDLKANIRTHIPDFEMATEIMNLIAPSPTSELVAALEEIANGYGTDADIARAALAAHGGKK